jgi:hypothetical protein
MDRQCPSCGGFCKKSGCERENVRPDSDTQLKDALELQEVVKEFFNRFLNRVEDSEEGKLFNPVTIGCCRALMIQPLHEILERMRVLSGAEPNPLYSGRDDD